MKKSLGLITIISCAFVLALSFTSCSSDDGPKISKNSYYVGLYVTSGKPQSSIASGDDGRAYLASVDAKLLAISKQFGAEHVTQAEAKKNYQNMVAAMQEHAASVAAEPTTHTAKFDYHYFAGYGPKGIKGGYIETKEFDLVYDGISE